MRLWSRTDIGCPRKLTPNCVCLYKRVKAWFGGVEQETTKYIDILAVGFHRTASLPPFICSTEYTSTKRRPRNRFAAIKRVANRAAIRLLVRI